MPTPAGYALEVFVGQAIAIDSVVTVLVDRLLEATALEGDGYLYGVDWHQH